jgi:hypothetical protein
MNIGEPIRRVVRTEPEVPITQPTPERVPEKVPEKVP